MRYRWRNQGELPNCGIIAVAVIANCSCDLIISNGKEVIRVEVRRAKRDNYGRLTASLSNKAHLVAVIDYNDKMVLRKGIYFTDNIYFNFPKLKIKG